MRNILGFAVEHGETAEERLVIVALAEGPATSVELAVFTGLAERTLERARAGLKARGVIAREGRTWRLEDTAKLAEMLGAGPVVLEAENRQVGGTQGAETAKLAEIPAQSAKLAGIDAAKLAVSPYPPASSLPLPAPLFPKPHNTPPLTPPTSTPPNPGAPALFADLPVPRGGETTRLKARDPGRVSELRLAFDRFLAAYPSQIGADAAWRAWLKMRPGSELVARIMAALEWQVRTERWRAGIMPSPAKYLLDGRWKDDPKDYAPRGKDALEEAARRREWVA